MSDNKIEVKEEKLSIKLSNKCIIDYSVYKTKDRNNRHLTTEMFDDHPDNKRLNNTYAPFSLYNEEHIEIDGRVIYSMKKIYIDLEDDTGLECANVCLGSFSHWKKLLNNSIIFEEIESWKKEIQVMDLALVKKSCRDTVKQGGKAATQAGKLLTSLNNQDPNSKINIDKIKKQSVNIKTKDLDSNSISNLEQQILDNQSRLN